MKCLCLPILTATLLTAAAPGHAADCAALRHALRAEAPPGPVSGPTVDNTGCTADELKMFEVNLNAVERAVPVTDPAQLYGTWLGDDVLMSLLGITVPGQETLTFAPGAQPEHLKVTQHWFKANPPLDFALPWQAGFGYTGVLAMGELQPYGEGIYIPSFDAPILYSGTTFEHERSYDLYVKARVNHFEREVIFALDGDTLVVRSVRLSQPEREPEEAVATYTRVAEGAADLALMLVIALEVYQAINFECFVHQLSDGAGPLLDAFAPLTVDEVEAMLGESFYLESEVYLPGSIVGPELSRPQPAPQALEARQRASAAWQAPELQALIERLKSADLGCPDFPY